MNSRVLLGLLFCLTLLAPSISVRAAEGDTADSVPPEVKRKKKQPKKKADEYENSKYKSYRVLTDDESKTYRFDANGKPIPRAQPKKKKKKKLTTEDAEACTEENPNAEACVSPKVDGDAAPTE